MTMDEKFKQVEDCLANSETAFYGGIERTDQFVPYNRNEEIRRETISLQLWGKKPTDCGCVTVRADDGELVDDYDLCAYCD